MQSLDSAVMVPQGLDSIRRENLARLLIRTFDMIEEDVLAGFAMRGIQLKRTWLPVLRNVDVQGSRITHIAAASGLSKQTIGPLVKTLVSEGILQTGPDPSDGRAKIVTYTDDGLRGLKIGMEVLQETEQRYAAAVGKRNLQQLRDTLLRLLAAFERGDGSPPA